MSQDHLLLEIDRQLAEQRARADSFASKSGLLIAASAVVTGLIASGTDPKSINPWILLSVGAGAALGVLVLCMGRILLGPSTSPLIRWTRTISSQDLLFDAKVVAVEANSVTLTRTEIVFLLQALFTVSGIIWIVSVQL
jgi:hypothetical protein